jgi:hypothetical protein
VRFGEHGEISVAMPAIVPVLQPSLTDTVTISRVSRSLSCGPRVAVPKFLFKSGQFKFEENSIPVCDEFVPKYRFIANAGFKPVC